eukprot:GHVP01017024.1.p1 GENE.GHVP01017024.1~~GHVP01017024.1.p1  ORF type:complete len:109 (-),score=6.31 GHVP01017024.1:144-470(-)
MVKKRSGPDSGVLSQLTLISKSGKINIGYKTTLKAMRSGKAKVIVVSNNTSPLRRSQLMYYALIGRVAVEMFKGTNNDMGTAFGKKFSVGCAAVTDFGDAEGNFSVAR